LGLTGKGPHPSCPRPLGKAIERDPQYGPALALAARCRCSLAANDWADDTETNRSDGIRLARRALRCAPDDPEVLALAGFVLGLFGEDINVAIGLIDRSLTLNPSFARGYHWSGVLRNFAGQPDAAMAHFEISLRLSPRDRLGGNLGTGLGASHFLNRRFDDAAAILLASLEEAPSFAVTYRLLAACYAHLGRLDDARRVIERLRAITAIVVPSVIPYRNPEHRDLFLSGLRLAAGEA
jgi:tetratricopeptide (TPR) repeat protein